MPVTTRGQAKLARVKGLDNKVVDISTPNPSPTTRPPRRRGPSFRVSKRTANTPARFGWAVLGDSFRLSAPPPQLADAFCDRCAQLFIQFAKTETGYDGLTRPSIPASYVKTLLCKSCLLLVARTILESDDAASLSRDPMVPSVRLLESSENRSRPPGLAPRNAPSINPVPTEAKRDKTQPTSPESHYSPTLDHPAPPPPAPPPRFAFARVISVEDSCETVKVRKYTMRLPSRKWEVYDVWNPPPTPEPMSLDSPHLKTPRKVLGRPLDSLVLPQGWGVLQDVSNVEMEDPTPAPDYRAYRVR